MGYTEATSFRFKLYVAGKIWIFRLQSLNLLSETILKSFIILTLIFKSLNLFLETILKSFIILTFLFKFLNTP